MKQRVNNGGRKTCFFCDFTDRDFACSTFFTKALTTEIICFFLFSDSRRLRSCKFAEALVTLFPIDNFIEDSECTLVRLFDE